MFFWTQLPSLHYLLTKAVIIFINRTNARFY